MTVISKFLGRTGNRADKPAGDEAGLWRGVVDTLLHGVVVIDSRGIIRHANPAVERLSGYSGGELVGNNVRMLCPPPHDRAHDSYLANYLRSRNPKVIGLGRDTECQRKDGSVLPVHLSVSELVIGGETLFVGVLDDISERLAVQTELKASEEFSRSIVTGAVDAIITIDSRGAIKSFNPAAEKLFRCSASDVLGKNVSILVPEPHRQDHDRYISNYLRTGQARIIGIGREAVGQRFDGTTFPLEIAVSECKTGDTHLFTAMIRDITDRKTAEAGREKEAAQAKVSELLDRLTHTVGDYTAVIEKATLGDLTQRVGASGDEVLLHLGNNLNVMLSSFREIARSVTDAVRTISSSVKELESTTTSLSANSAEQAASVTETTSALEEIRAVSRQTLEKASGLGELAENTLNASERGQQFISDIVGGMTNIREKVQNIADTILALSEQTQQIGEITDMVSRLAQESKMLALNASIEAAKAGEAGVGFAVVAAEVKALAEQSEQATGQVRKILREVQHATDRAVMTTEEGTKQVEHGMLMVQHTNEAFRHLAEAVESTALNSRQIIAAVRQESIGIDQITTAMAEINNVTGLSVEMARQTKAAASRLAQLAQELDTKVKFYKV